MSLSRFLLLAALAVMWIGSSIFQVRAQSSKQDAAGVEFFENKIRPVLAANCYACHSASAPKPQGGLLLDTREGLRKGGNSGPAIAPGDPDASLLIKALRYTDPGLKMPPGKPLSKETVADFEQWIKTGAVDPRTDDAKRIPGVKEKRQFWSFRPPAMPQIPEADASGWARTPVDRFIVAKLQ